MEFLQELFLTAFMAVVLSVIVAASIAFSGGDEKGVSVIKIGDEKKLKVVGGKTRTKTKTKSKKKVKFVGEFVVKDVEDAERLNLDLKFLENFDGILQKSLEDEISRDEVNIVKMFDTDEAEVTLSPVVKEIGNVKLADAEDMGGNGFPLIDDVLEKAVSEVPESKHFKGNSQLGSGSEIRYAAEEMKRNEIDSITELNMVDDDGGKDCTSAVLLDETLNKGAVGVMNQSTDIGVDTDKGIKETEVSAFDGGLENSRNRALANMSDESEDDGALYEDSNVVAMKEDLGESSTVDDDDDDWEGIERSELEKVFAKAVNYVEYGGKDKNDELTNMGSNVQAELYGLHKLAVEGPCYEPQPMALKVYARARWVESCYV